MLFLPGNVPVSSQGIIPRYLALAVFIAGLAALELHRTYAANPDLSTDFNIVWLGAKAILAGGDPYTVTGPGAEYAFRWPPLYPATALVVALPLGLLSEHGASIAFVFLSTLALAYGIIRHRPYLLPLFASEAFFSSVHLAQWSIVLTAALFLPWLQSIAIAKPQVGLAIIAGARSRAGATSAAIGAVIIFALSLALVPGWVPQWLKLVQDAEHMRPPLFALGGPIVLLVALRWRRPEAWLILAMLIIPQNFAWYNTLPLLTVARSFRESAVLSIVSTLGMFAGHFIEGTPENFGAVLIATTYLPATIAVLRQPARYNPGIAPASSRRRSAIAGRSGWRSAPG